MVKNRVGTLIFSAIHHCRIHRTRNILLYVLISIRVNSFGRR